MTDVSAAVPARIGVDVGGTFTDLVYFNQTGKLRVGKGLTTPGSPDEGVVEVLRDSLSDPELREASMFIHATTVALNTLLQRTGATVGLLMTQGFRDVLELRRGERLSLNDPLWKPADPLVPRRRCLPVTERTLASGDVSIPLDRAEVASAAAEFERQGVEVIAVVFLHSYRNPAHELEAQAVLRESGFAGDIVLSHGVSGEYREYERASTTTIDAYVRPTMSHYLDRLGGSLRTMGFEGELLATTSGGGSMTFRQADSNPTELIQSGPAGGAAGTAELCRDLEINLAIMADVGGTSFDTSLVSDGRAAVKYEGEVDQMPVQKPWLDVRSVGAGGGSVIHLDRDGVLRVGPKSAGSDPGPAALGRGGTAATATDAAAVLGMLGFGELGGGMSLDFELAHSALKPIATDLGTEVEGAAAGALTILASTMANAIREVTIEQGVDPREAALVAIGGAGPLFATLLADDLELDRVVVPRHAGVFSAWGLLGQDLVRSAARTVLVPLDDDALEVVSGVLADLFLSLRTETGDGLQGLSYTAEASLDIRYVGQEYPLTIPITLEKQIVADRADGIAEAFLAESSRAYGYRRQAPMQISSVRANLRLPLPRRETATASEGPAPSSERAIEGYSFVEGARVPFRVIERDALVVSEPVAGPAILTEETTTTYLDRGWVAHESKAGALMVAREAPYGDR